MDNLNLTYKTIDNVIWFLGELFATDEKDIESNDFDVACETESGADSRFSVSIVDLANDAKLIINKQQQEIKDLKMELSTIKAKFLDGHPLPSTNVGVDVDISRLKSAITSGFPIGISDVSIEQYANDLTIYIHCVYSNYEGLKKRCLDVIPNGLNLHKLIIQRLD